MAIIMTRKIAPATMPRILSCFIERLSLLPKKPGAGWERGRFSEAILLR